VALPDGALLLLHLLPAALQRAGTRFRDDHLSAALGALIALAYRVCHGPDTLLRGVDMIAPGANLNGVFAV
jgi:hypothetical protein